MQTTCTEMPGSAYIDACALKGIRQTGEKETKYNKMKNITAKFCTPPARDEVFTIRISWIALPHFILGERICAIGRPLIAANYSWE